MEKQKLKHANSLQKGNVTVDAVHPRLLNKSKHTHNRSSSLERSAEVSSVYCEQCNENIERTTAALKNHFESSPHESQPCVYCYGPVYKYICRSEENFHECISNTMQREESDSTSSLSRDEGSGTSEMSKDDGSDTSEMQNVSTTQNIAVTSLLYAHDTDIPNLEGT
jgi:hypothetical protein